MNCKEFKDYIDNNLIENGESLDEKHRLHLEECEDCKHLYEEYQKIEKGFDAIRATALPKDFHENLMAEINPKDHHVSIFLRNKKLGVVAALFIIFFSSYAVYDYALKDNFGKDAIVEEMAMDVKGGALNSEMKGEASFERKEEAKALKPTGAKPPKKGNDNEGQYAGDESDKKEEAVSNSEERKKEEPIVITTVQIKEKESETSTESVSTTKQQLAVADSNEKSAERTSSQEIITESAEAITSVSEESSEEVILANSDEIRDLILNGENIDLNENLVGALFSILDSGEELSSVEVANLKFEDELTYYDESGLVKLALQRLEPTSELADSEKDYYVRKNDKVYRVNKKFYEILRARR